MHGSHAYNYHNIVMCSRAQSQAHFPVPSAILFRMVFNVIPEWVPGKFPIGFSFSSKVTPV